VAFIFFSGLAASHGCGKRKTSAVDSGSCYGAKHVAFESWTFALMLCIFDAIISGENTELCFWVDDCNSYSNSYIINSKVLDLLIYLFIYLLICY